MAKDLAGFLGEIGRCIRLLQPRTRPNTKRATCAIVIKSKTEIFSRRTRRLRAFVTIVLTIKMSRRLAAPTQS